MTTVTEDTPFALEDDTYHRLSDDINETETNWWSLNVPERKMGAWIHAAYFPNRKSVRTRVFVWGDDKGADPNRLPYYFNSGEVPFPADVDMRDVTYPAGGYHLKMLKPAMDYYVRHHDPEQNFTLEFEHRSVHPPHRFTPGEAPAMHNPHFDQLGRITGEMKLNGETIAIDCYSVRDRTWGPRVNHHHESPQPTEKREYRVANPGGPKWREVERERGRGRIQYIFGHTGAETGFLSFVRPQDGDAQGWSPLNMGWLLKDGRFTRLDKGRSKMKNYRDPGTGWSQHMEVVLVDREGRSMEAEGFAVSHMCEHGTGSNALMRWEYDGKVGWGEDQDGWRPPHFVKLLRALRDTGKGG
jgi:hypothetical protein